ncbi:hypothetical protein [Intrasporangium mesophilum]
MEESRSEAARRRMVEAQQRAVRASQRVGELQALVIRLESGETLTEADLRGAEAAMREATEAAEAARRHSREERILSATTHRQVAALLTRMGRDDRASGHLRAAEADEQEAREVEAPGQQGRVASSGW